jgi:hypothetical protein
MLAEILLAVLFIGAVVFGAGGLIGLALWWETREKR